MRPDRALGAVSVRWRSAVWVEAWADYAHANDERLFALAIDVEEILRVLETRSIRVVEGGDA